MNSAVQKENLAACTEQGCKHVQAGVGGTRTAPFLQGCWNWRTTGCQARDDDFISFQGWEPNHTLANWNVGPASWPSTTASEHFQSTTSPILGSQYLRRICSRDASASALGLQQFLTMCHETSVFDGF